MFLDSLKPEQIIYTFNAMDSDKDSRLKYEIEEIKCFTILFQNVKNCKNLFYIKNERNNASLIVSSLFPMFEKQNLIEKKINSLSKIYFNISVEDTQHRLEPKSTSLFKINIIYFLAMIVLTLTRNETKISNKRRFLNINRTEIYLNDNLPINTQVYTVVLTPIKKNDLIKYYFSKENQYFNINQENGIFFYQLIIF